MIAAMSRSISPGHQNSSKAARSRLLTTADVARRNFRRALECEDDTGRRASRQLGEAIGAISRQYLVCAMAMASRKYHDALLRLRDHRLIFLHILARARAIA